MCISKKLVATGPSRVSHASRQTPLPAFPAEAKDIGTYLQAINPVIETCLVTKSSREDAKTDKLRLVIAFLNLYRIVETFSTDEISHELQILTQSGQIGEKLLKFFDFLILAKNNYANEPDFVERFYQSQTMFNSESYENHETAQTIIDAFLEIYPPNGETDKPRNEKHRTWSGSDESDDKYRGSTHPDSKTLGIEGPKALSALDLHVIDDEHETHPRTPRKLSGSGSDHSKESDPSSQGREDFVSLTSATLRRTLKNYWRAKEVGLVIQDQLLRALFDKSIVGQAHQIDAIEAAIAFFPLELAFLWDRESQTVTAFDIGKSHAIEIRDLMEAEKIRYTVILHNHPHGDTFSLDDLVICSNKEAKEVRAVTISCESPDTMAFKSYRCEILDIPGFDTAGRKHLLNAFYLFFTNGEEIDNEFDRTRLATNTLKYRENQFSVLEQTRLVLFHDSCDKTYILPLKTTLLQWFQNESKCNKRGLNTVQRNAALRHLTQ